MTEPIEQVSFTKGEVSPIAAARTDTAFYASALGSCVNFFVRAEGAVSNRPGLQYIAQCVSAPNGSYLLPFIYNNSQAYLVEMSSSPLSGNPGSINIYLSGALVQSVPAPYAPADLSNIRWAQSADTLNLVVVTQPLYQLKRLTVNNFTMTAPTLLNGPFQDLNTDGQTTVYVSGTQGTVTITSSLVPGTSAGIFLPAHVGALFTIEEQFLGSIQSWQAQGALSISGNSPIGQYCRSDGKIYQCVANVTSQAGGTTYTGTFQPVHTSGSQTDGTGKPIPGATDSISGVLWQFVSQASGVALITAYADSQHVTAVIQSDKGVYSNFPPTVVGGPQTVQGPFTKTGDGSTATFTGLTGITTGDPNQFYVTLGGVFADPTTYSINQSGTSITFHQIPAAGVAISIAQVTGTLNINTIASPTLLPGLALSTYWAFGSFSKIQGYGATVVYFNDRLVLGGTLLQPQTLFTSKTSNYLDFGSSTPSVADDDITVTLNARRENAIVDLISQNDLLIGTSSAVTRLTHSASSGSITPSDVDALPQNFYGQQNVPSVQTGDTTIYVQWGGRKIRDLIYQFQTDKYQGTELTVFARQMFPYGTTCVRASFAPEPYGLLFCVRSDGALCVCAYLPEQQVTAWSRYLTAGFFEDVCVLPENGTFSVYVIVRRVVNGATVRYIEKFAPREYITNDDAFFVDSGLTFDGRQSGSTVTFTANTTSVAIAAIFMEGFGDQFLISVQTTLPHNLTQGQAVTVAGVIGSGSFSINGSWMVVGISDPNNFNLAIISGPISGAYTSGGEVTSQQTVAGYAGNIVSSGAPFSASDVTNKNAVWINDASGNRLCRLQIVQFVAPNNVNVKALDPVPPAVVGVSQGNWTFAKTNFSGLTNLKNATIAIYADGSVMSQQVVQADGTFKTPNAAGVLHAGLPYSCQLQSMSPNIQGKPPIRDKAKLIPNLSVIVDQSAPFYAGTDFDPDHMVQFLMREFENYGDPIALKTGVVQQKLLTTSSEDLTICIQHVDPVPLTILGWIADLSVEASG
jgi:hypothetical protein